MSKAEKEIQAAQQPEFSFRKYSWKQFKRNKPALISLYVLSVFAFVALLAPYIANERPLYAKYKGQNFYPAFTVKPITDFRIRKAATALALQVLTIYFSSAF